MCMENESENFEQLRRLLALKKHELPPPGYFNRFSGQVIGRLQAERAADSDVFSKLNTEAPWLARLWQGLAGRPAFAGAFGAAICAVLLGGIFLAEKPAAPSPFASSVQPESPFLAASPVNASPSLNQPLLAATNTSGAPIPNLFEMFQPYPGQEQTVAAPAPGN
jgi:hypothetical protein